MQCINDLSDNFPDHKDFPYSVVIAKIEINDTKHKELVGR